MDAYWQQLNWPTIGEKAVVDLQNLLRIDTTNPPGNERLATEYVAESLRADGLEPIVLEAAPDRTNLVCRIEGTDDSLPPLLLSAHLDVVEAVGDWTHPPFEGRRADGYLWGRGAVDMKNMAVMSMWVMKLLARREQRPRRTVIFAAIADEETGCDLGSTWLVDNHVELIKSGYVLSEIGGFTLHLQGRRFYPIQVAEKGQVYLKLKARGNSGHGSIPMPGNTIAQLSEALLKLDRQFLPKHITPVMSEFIRQVAAELPFPLKRLFPLLLTQAGDTILRVLPASQANPLRASLHNTVSPTVLRAGNKDNVIPADAEALLDGRTLPGQTADDLIREVRDIIGNELEIEPYDEMPPVSMNDYRGELFDILCDTVRTHDPGGIPVPWLCNGFTDAKAYSRMGARFYGFSPLQLPPELEFSKLFHGIDERIPVEGFKWGLQVLTEAVARFSD
jgi:acetylornithine deacetylase/succinyl-diaminopimelate desuccinylase-like protein